jgi:hypothetical protein
VGYRTRDGCSFRQFSKNRAYTDQKRNNEGGPPQDRAEENEDEDDKCRRYDLYPKMRRFSGRDLVSRLTEFWH